MARQAGLDPAPHAGNAGEPAEKRQSGRRSESETPYQIDTPEYAKNETRARRAQGSAGRGRHLLAPGLLALVRFAEGPQPNLPDDWHGGFLCPCHGSTFDLAGRVFKNKPAPANLDVPPYMYLSDNKIVIGKDEKGEA
jgi:ubiquinol-cytochrome c reductase iron-sulfur subunit